MLTKAALKKLNKTKNDSKNWNIVKYYYNFK